MSENPLSMTPSSVRNNRVLRRALIPKEYHYAAKLMAESLGIRVGEIYDQAVLSFLNHCPPNEPRDYILVGRKNNPQKICFWLDAQISSRAKDHAAKLGITEHAVILTAIFKFGQKHKFTQINADL